MKNKNNNIMSLTLIVPCTMLGSMYAGYSQNYVTPSMEELSGSWDNFDPLNSVEVMLGAYGSATISVILSPNALFSTASFAGNRQFAPISYNLSNGNILTTNNELIFIFGSADALIASAKFSIILAGGTFNQDDLFIPRSLDTSLPNLRNSVFPGSQWGALLNPSILSDGNGELVPDGLGGYITNADQMPSEGRAIPLLAATNTLSFEFFSNRSTEGIAFSIGIPEAIPEPSAMIAFVTSGLMLGFRRTRK